ncbi:MAG: class I SAM-dependent methyltransferase [Actinobacteria bacterium]|nr:MAG: class I SAM-dependent methyltransferase [Actinomycetota bacterium]
MAPDPGPACAACGARDLRLRHRVAGEAGQAGLIPTTDRYGTALGDLLLCSACGHMQTHPPPSAAQLRAGYAEAASDDYLEEEAGQRETARRALAHLEEFASPGRLLDVGCWTGFLLDEARRRGWEPLGLEPSRFARTYARERLGLPVLDARLEDAELPAGELRAAVMADVVEHLLDPGRALARVRGWLGPEGVLCLMLPDAGSRVARAMGRRWWSVLPTHVQYFTRHSLAVLLGRHGFDVLAQTTAPKAFTVGYYLRRTSGYSEGLSAALVAGSRALGLADRLWAPDFGDRMLMVARRAPQSAAERPRSDARSA